MPFNHLKIAAILIAVVISATVASGQKEPTGFGAFTAEEISMKECSFDKDADAVVLLDEAKSSFNDYNNLITERRIRFKILKERGIERGNIRINYYSNEDFEFVSNLAATVLSLDDQKNHVWSKLDNKSVYPKKLNKYYSQISFALPNIKVGSIVEYKYQSQMKHYGGLREWIFQSDMPVVLSSYDLVIVPNAEFAYSIYKDANLPITVKPNKQSGSVLFQMENLPGLRDEAYIGSAHDYLQRVKFQFSGYKDVTAHGYGITSSTTTKYTTTWKDLARELLDEQEFGSQLNKTLPGVELVQAAWANETSPYLKMKAVHEYVRSHFNWDHIYSKYADGRIKETWEKKTGNSGGINLILVNLLKSAGLEVQPLLVTERDHGKIDTTYPYINQFLKVVAYVTIDDKHYVLDGTDRQTPSSTIPFKMLNTVGFIVDKKKPALILLDDKDKKSLNLVNILGNVNNGGTMDLQASVKSYDYAKIERKAKYTSNKVNYEKEFFAPNTLSTSDSFNVDGLEYDSLPLEHTAKLTYALNKTGDYLLLNYNLFTGITKNPFVSEHRFSDIDFGCRNSWVLNGTFNLPENLVPEALPKSVKLVTPDQSMTIIRQVQQIGNAIHLGVKIDFSKTLYSADDYPDVQGFYKKMVELLNEPIVLKAKS